MFHQESGNVPSATTTNKVSQLSIKISVLACSGSQSCRVEPPLAPSDAQRNFEPERSDGLLKQ
eukprot:8648026-Heterocapsa_arctica.AAC.1